MNKAIEPFKPPSKRLGWLIHIVAWAVLLTFPFLFTGRESEVVTWNRYLGFLFVLGSYIIAFYTNYSCLVKRFLFTRLPVRYLLSNLLLIAVLILAVHLLMGLLPNDRFRPDLTYRDMMRFLVANTLGYIFVITISVAYKMTGSWFTAEAERKELERSRSEAELTNLKSQLNPHFLFNTLNNIYSLIAISPERAQEVVHELSRLLRYVLYESTQSFVTMEKDVDFIRNYVELMRIRLPGHVSVKTSITYTSPDMPIAPLLFITPIENAFKHGVSNSKPSFIRIELHATGGEASCRIHNSYFPKDGQDKSGSGIGLANLRKRLDLIYPGKYHFSYGREEDTYYCELKLCQLSLK
ncbi:MAG: histidine kinase [Tannerellaceae bacterium]|jgi:sensor histidine kinase YesM|nr:histidine kinase [Tannerellaceae bacterium]